MFRCPHCRQEIETGPEVKRPWWQYNPGPTVNLGCGTLILIAIIVAIFSNTGDDGRQLRALHDKVQTVERKIDMLGDQIRKLPAPANRQAGGQLDAR